MTTLHVDCATCTARPRACGDCVISVLLGRPDDQDAPVSLESDEQAALRALASSGLVPPLRLVRPVEAGPVEGPPQVRRA